MTTSHSMSDAFPLPQANPAVTEFLERRRSNSAKLMTGPGPDTKTLTAILTTAARVPDHRKLEPWRFIVIEGEARERLGAVLRKRHLALHPDASDKAQAMEAERFLRAPVVVAVVSSPKPCRKNTPVWEQELSVGAVCLKMCMAAQARGYAAQWLTEWYSYDADVAAAMGLLEGERFAGFVYMGTTQTASAPRPRPDMAGLVTYA